MQKKLSLPSGHELTINAVPYKTASRLRRLVSGELRKVSLQLSDAIIPALFSAPEHRKLNVLAALSGTEVNTLKDLLCQLLASEEIEEAVLACMVKWTLCGEPVKAETFEPNDRRGDLIPCAVEVFKEALLPFFESLALLSPSPSDGTSESQK